jgi:hypothetical protein
VERAAGRSSCLPQMPQLPQCFCTPDVLELEGKDQKEIDHVRGEIGNHWVTGAAEATRPTEATHDWKPSDTPWTKISAFFIGAPCLNTQVPEAVTMRNWIPASC